MEAFDYVSANVLGAVFLLSGWIGLIYSFPLECQCFRDHVLFAQFIVFCGGYSSFGQLGFLSKSFSFLHECGRWISNLRFLLTTDLSGQCFTALQLTHLLSLSKTTILLKDIFKQTPLLGNIVQVEREFGRTEDVDGAESSDNM